MSFMGFGSAKDDDDDKKKSGGGSGIVFIVLAVLIALALAPLTVILFVILAIVGERRLVRLSRWLAATGVAFVAALAAAKFDLNEWLGWFNSAPALLWGGLFATDNPISLLAGLASTKLTHTPATLLAQHILTATPTALLIMSGWWWYRSYALSLRAENEGEQYSNIRPVGWLDQRRIDRNTAALRDGSWTNKHEDIAVGVGHYGEVATLELGDLKKATLIVGTSQSGKTRQANSLAAQEVLELGGGNIVIDLKPSDEMTASKAELARRLGVPFLHFQLLSPTGGGYKSPHPYAPKWPAHYDPLQNGNGASKAAMLLNSVARDGDAAVYKRTADEAVKLAYDIAALTGFDKTVNRHGHPISGLSVLSRMLDPETLVATGRAVSVDQVLRANPFLSRQAAEAKVESIVERIESFEKALKSTNSTLTKSLEDVQTLVASYINDPSAGPFLTPGTRPALRIDLVRAMLRNEIVVFSLDAQSYPEMSAMIATMVILDLQNAVSTLRTRYGQITQFAEENGTLNSEGDNPWNPMVLQIEEISAVRSPAAAEAMLGLFNKSADVGIRPILSTQSLADIEAVDGTGVWLRQLMAQLDNLMTLQLSEAQDAEKIAAFSGLVQKKIATEQKDVANNRTGLFQGAGAAGRIIARTEEHTRIGAGEALQLARSGDGKPGEMLWISKVPRLQAVHTTTPEGPNNWSEKLLLVPVHEPPHHWKPFAEREFVEEAASQRDDVFNELINDLKHNRLLFDLLEGARAQDAVRVEQTTTQVQEALSAPAEALNPDDPFDLPAPQDPADADTLPPDDDYGFDELAEPSDDWPEDDGFDDVDEPVPAPQSAPAARPAAPEMQKPSAQTSDELDDDDPFA